MKGTGELVLEAEWKQSLSGEMDDIATGPHLAPTLVKDELDSDGISVHPLRTCSTTAVKLEALQDEQMGSHVLTIGLGPRRSLHP